MKSLIARDVLSVMCPARWQRPSVTTVRLSEKPLLLLCAVKRLHSYLYGCVFKLRTNHKPLLRIFGENCGLPATAMSRLQRWAVILSGYDYIIEHLTGHENGVADCLYCIPLKLSPEQESAVTNAVEDNARDPVEDCVCC